MKNKQWPRQATDDEQHHHRTDDSYSHSRHRRKRPLARGELQYLVLSLIADTPRHGYDLIGAIENCTNGTYKPSAGTMYPILDLLQDIGWAKVKLTKSKRVFHITKEGEACLKSNEQLISKITTRLKQLDVMVDVGAHQDARLAMNQLRHLVKTSLKDTHADDEKKEKIIKIIHSARDQIAAIK
ncbi:MAG: PadR family transcriptional regulator [Robiginitomaculum sp.]|nr:MAG: PadR family transcriptional regulator [Robiginitomaculum sp.]